VRVGKQLDKLEFERLSHRFAFSVLRFAPDQQTDNLKFLKKYGFFSIFLPF